MMNLSSFFDSLPFFFPSSIPCSFLSLPPSLSPTLQKICLCCATTHFQKATYRSMKLLLQIMNLNAEPKKYLTSNTMYKIMCVFTYTYSQNTTICQIVLICNKQHYVIYNYVFRPCKRAIIRLFTEPSSRLHNTSLGGTRSRLT